MKEGRKGYIVAAIIALAIACIWTLARSAVTVGLDGKVLAFAIGSIAALAAGYGGFRLKEYLG